eukprot:1747680-Amphidinium_carterae.1
MSRLAAINAQTPAVEASSTPRMQSGSYNDTGAWNPRDMRHQLLYKLSLLQLLKPWKQHL